MAKEYITPKYTTAEEIKRVRNSLDLTQKEFASFIGVSKPTVERWEAGAGQITGPVVFLIEILRRSPDLKKEFEIPDKETPVRLKYYYRDMLCTIIDVDESKQKIKIRNYTDNLIFRAFGRNEKPTFKDYEEFLESRCFPQGRDKMKLMLKQYDIPFYDPFLIIEKTGGRMEEDEFHIEIER
ncbi:MAG: type II toxin-antitoxin system MqsA family antitoxin [Lachnospiraceae bacterium]|nr:type II toxin-antitoxin system MqsA family antitoxin [Lachnospiraceae bacterium]